MTTFDVSKFRFVVGATVRYATWLRQYDQYVGRIIARCYQEDSQTRGIRYLVKWIAPDGDPSAEPDWIKDDELEPVAIGK